MTSDYSTYLTTMAQVAGVLVGFANLANAINRPGMSEDELYLNKLRIIITTETGLLLIGACLMPLLFNSLNNYRNMSAIMGLISLTYHVLMFKRVVIWTGKQFPLKSSKYFHVAQVFLILIPLLLNSLGLFGEGNYALVYCIVIFVLFVFVATFFCRLLYSVLPQNEGASH